MYENIRQMCIYEKYYKSDPKIFWDYMKSIHQLCYSSVNQACSADAHKEIGLDVKDTLKCLADSFSMQLSKSDFYNDERIYNSYIEREMQEQKKAQISLIPTL